MRVIKADIPFVETLLTAPGVVPVRQDVPWRPYVIAPPDHHGIGRVLAVAGHRLAYARQGKRACCLVVEVEPTVAAVEQSTGLFHSSRSWPENWGRTAFSFPVFRWGLIPGRRRSGRSGSAAARCRGKRFSWAAGWSRA